jgi:hypothetical protein
MEMGAEGEEEGTIYCRRHDINDPLCTCLSLSLSLCVDTRKQTSPNKAKAEGEGREVHRDRGQAGKAKG